MPRKTPSNEAPPESVPGRGLARGLMLLEVIARGGRDGLRVVDLCRACALERPTVHRLLGTLIGLGHVARCGRFRYGPGPALGRLHGVGAPSELAVALQPVLAVVSQACGDAAFAVVRDGHRSCCIARHVGTHPVQILSVQVGTRQPLGVGAAGLALLAALDDVEVCAIVAASRPTLSSYGGMTPTLLGSLVRSTRQRGWSVVGNHAVQGALGVGMAVVGADGAPVAAISVAAAVERMPRPRQQEIARVMREALATLKPAQAVRRR